MNRHHDPVPTSSERPSTFQSQLDGVARVGSGHYTGSLDEGWAAPLYPQGGLVMALALHALALELDRPDQRLRSATGVFATSIESGRVDIEAEVVRRGRTISQGRAHLANEGAGVGHLVTAVFGATREGFEFTDLQVPDVPPPGECRSFRHRPIPDGVPASPMWERLDIRVAYGHDWTHEEWIPTSSQRALWMRFDDTPELPDGRTNPLAFVVMCDMMVGSTREKLGTSSGAWLAPSADLTVHLFGDTRSEWLLGVNRCRLAGEGYASAEMELWDVTERRLVAYATQLMFFSFPQTRSLREGPRASRGTTRSPR